MNPLFRSLKEDSLSSLGVDVLDHWLIVVASELLIVLISLGVGSPPQHRGSDIIGHV